MAVRGMKKAAQPTWRVLKFKINECSLVDRPANDQAVIESIQIAKREEKPMSLDFNNFRKSTSGVPGYTTFPIDRGAGGAGVKPDYAFDPAKVAAALARELVDVITELATPDGGGDVSDPDVVLERAAKVAIARLRAKVTDYAADGPAAAQSAATPGFPTSKRAASKLAPEVQRLIDNVLERQRLEKLSGGTMSLLEVQLQKNDRSSAPGMSSSLLKAEAASDDIAKRSADVNLDLRIETPEQLADRISKRSTERQPLGFSALYGGEARPFRGSYSPGCLGVGDEFGKTLVERVTRLHNEEGSVEFEKLLH